MRTKKPGKTYSRKFFPTVVSPPESKFLFYINSTNGAEIIDHLQHRSSTFCPTLMLQMMIVLYYYYCRNIESEFRLDGVGAIEKRHFGPP